MTTGQTILVSIRSSNVSHAGKRWISTVDNNVWEVDIFGGNEVMSNE